MGTKPKSRKEKKIKLELSKICALDVASAVGDYVAYLIEKLVEVRVLTKTLKVNKGKKWFTPYEESLLKSYGRLLKLQRKFDNIL